MRGRLASLMLAAALGCAGPALAQTADAEPPAEAAPADEAEQLRAEVARFRAVVDQLSEQNQRLTVERDQAVAALGTAEGAVAACEVKNVRLADLSKEILELYDRKGFAAVLFQREPLIGAKRVEVENLIQDYGDKVYDNRFDRRVDGAPGGSAPPAEPAPPAAEPADPAQTPPAPGA